MWSDQRELERQQAVGRLLDMACERGNWEGQSLGQYCTLRESGSLSEAIFALIEAGDVAPRSAEFWEAVQQAAEMLWLDHPWATNISERTRRMEQLMGLRSRIKGWDG